MRNTLCSSLLDHDTMSPPPKILKYIHKRMHTMKKMYIYFLFVTFKKEFAKNNNP